MKVMKEELLAEKDSLKAPVLKINNHGNHGWGTTGIWRDQRDVIVSFGPPKIIVLSLKFRL